MLNKYSTKELASVEKLENVIKFYLDKKDKNLNFDKILEHIEVIKSYDVDSAPYRCEWLDPIALDLVDLNEQHCAEEEKEDLLAGKKIGNMQTYNYKKVPRVI